MDRALAKKNDPFQKERIVKIMKVINLTPHYVNICDKWGNIIKTYETMGKDRAARVSHGYETIDIIDGVPISIRQNEHLINLPDPEEGVMYIVSNIVLDYCRDRVDLLAPVKQVKVDGRVIGCRSFMSNSGRES